MASHDDIDKMVAHFISVFDIERGQFSGYNIDRTATPLKRYRNIDISHILDVDDDDEYIMVGNDCTPNVIWPIDVCIGFEGGRFVDGWTFTRCRTTTAREQRGRVSIVAPKMLVRDIVELDPQGRTFTAREVMSFVSGRWVDATYKTTTRQHDSVRNMPPPENYNTVCQMMIAHALRHRYEWSISIGEPDGPSFRFETNAAGVKQLLDERDKGDSGRREALRGWVRDHWRQHKNDPNIEIYVRKHLRGGEIFRWRGYECTWKPADFDVEQNEALRQERKLMGRQAARQR